MLKYRCHAPVLVCGNIYVVLTTLTSSWQRMFAHSNTEDDTLSLLLYALITIYDDISFLLVQGWLSLVNLV